MGTQGSYYIPQSTCAQTKCILVGRAESRDYNRLSFNLVPRSGKREKRGPGHETILNTTTAEQISTSMNSKPWWVLILYVSNQKLVGKPGNEAIL